MWDGMKLLAADVRGSAKILVKISRGKQITRRERNFIVQTGADLGRLIPFSLFLIIPLAEFALPFALRLFPNMLPSQFQSQMQKEEGLKRQLKANIELAKYLRDVVEEKAKSIKSSNKDVEIKREAEELGEFLQAIRSGTPVNINDVSRFARLFSDELTIDGAVRPQLVAMCKYMGISAHGTDQLLRYRLRSRLSSIKNDDMLISWEGGANSLTDEEVEKACRDRGIRAVDVPKSELRKQLNDWLEMSQNQAIPSSLMIMSRAFFYSGTDGLVETLSSLPDDVYDDVKQASDGGDSSLTDRLEEALRQTKLIEMESDREARKDKEDAKKDLEMSQKAADKPVEDVPQKGEGADLSEPAGPATQAVQEAQSIAEKLETVGTPTLSALKANAREDAAEERAVAGEDAAEPTLSPTQRAVAEALDGPAALPKDEEQRAKERAAMSRIVDALRDMSSESAVEQERLELSDLKLELAEAESVLASLGGGNESELRRFRRMVARLEREIERVDKKLGASMKLLDLDNDGVMSMGECKEAVKMLAADESDVHIVFEALRRLDADADGNISVQDIHRLMREIDDETAGIEPSDSANDGNVVVLAGEDSSKTAAKA